MSLTVHLVAMIQFLPTITLYFINSRQPWVCFSFLCAFYLSKRCIKKDYKKKNYLIPNWSLNVSSFKKRKLRIYISQYKSQSLLICFYYNLKKLLALFELLLMILRKAFKHSFLKFIFKKKTNFYFYFYFFKHLLIYLSALKK